MTAKVDHKFSDKDSLYGTIVWDRTPYSTPDGLNNVLLGDFTKDQMYIIEWTHTFKPTFVNSARFGFNRQRADVDYGVSAINPAAADTTLAANPGRTAAQVTGLGGGIGLMTGGVGSESDLLLPVELVSILRRRVRHGRKTFDQVRRRRGAHAAQRHGPLQS